MGTVFIHFSLIAAVCVYSSIDSYTSFYDIEKVGIKKKVLDVTYAIATATGFRQYTTIAGIEAGYGFFAPNVASEYVLSFALYDKDSTFIEKRALPNFKNKESYMRYSTLLGAFQDKLVAMAEEEDLNTLRQRHLNVIMKAMARQMLAKDKHLGKINTVLYLHHFPSLVEFREGSTQQQLISFENFEVSNPFKPLSVVGHDK